MTVRRRSPVPGRTEPNYLRFKMRTERCGELCLWGSVNKKEEAGHEVLKTELLGLSKY